jgi:hypothetical protein
MLRIPNCIDNRLTDGSKDITLMHGCTLFPTNIIKIYRKQFKKMKGLYAGAEVLF